MACCRQNWCATAPLASRHIEQCEMSSLCVGCTAARRLYPLWCVCVLLPFLLPPRGCVRNNKKRPSPVFYAAPGWGAFTQKKIPSPGATTASTIYGIPTEYCRVCRQYFTGRCIIYPRKIARVIPTCPPREWSELCMVSSTQNYITDDSLARAHEAPDPNARL